jgi:hypothetical protein
MSRTAHYTALGLASFGLVGSSLFAVTPAYAGDYEEVDGKDCLKYDDDKECKSETWLEAKEKIKLGGKSKWVTIKLKADVDFFKKEDKGDCKKDCYGNDEEDLGEVKFQYKFDKDDDWKTFYKEDCDEDGKADVKVKVKSKYEDEVWFRAKYSGVEDQIKDSKSDPVEVEL